MIEVKVLLANLRKNCADNEPELPVGNTTA